MIDTYLLPGENVHPEGIAADPDGETFYVSSARQGTIFRGRIGQPELEVWQPGGADGRGNALGLTVTGDGRLIVCGSESGYVFWYDTASGELVARRQVPAAETLLNDVCVAGGYAYVTDSKRPVIWRFALGGSDAEIGEAEEWLDLGEAELTPYLNGIVPALDDTVLLVAAQGTEVLWRVDIASRSAEKLDGQVSADGLVLLGGKLYACDNAETADGLEFYLSEFTLPADLRGFELARRWQRDTEQTPTTVAWLGGRMLLVNSQFVAGRNGTAAAPFTISAVEI
ncbi:SMP-30/gluconolactonase/LRE family protein [Longispora albida]|uniref:SMP-30/gluconolactonase/LRE family protein n=1 Tax=Longispora albida TaxID=203523 RepID=UPI0003612A42|nr:hypothetical protein [Longispora albida]